MLPKSRKKKLLFSCFILVVLLVLTYINHNSIEWNINSNHSSNLEVSNTAQDILNLGDGYSLGVDILDTTRQTIDKVNGVISVNNLQDNLEITFSNNTSNNQFICKIFYDYEEVQFKVLNEKEFNSAYVFNLETTKTIKIPFQLNNDILKDNKSHKLTVGIYEFSEDNSEKEEITNFYGMIIDYELFYAERSEVILNNRSTEVLRTIDNINFTGLMVNTDRNPSAKNNSITFPPNLIEVKKGEKVNLMHFVNMTNSITEDVEDYLILSMLDWKQIKMNNKPYLLIDKNSLSTEYGEFYIMAPAEEGLYRYTAFIIPNADKNKSEDNFFPVEMSYEFTIKVVS